MRLLSVVLVFAPLVLHAPCALARPDPESVELVVEAGTPLRVALDERVKVKRVGQSLSATVVQPVYAFDRVVIPVGASVEGHLATIKGPSGSNRVRSLLKGDLTPTRGLQVSFDRLILPDGEAFTLDSVVTSATENVDLQVAGAAQGTGVVAQARQEIASKAKHAIAVVTQPGKGRRLRDWLRDRLLGILPARPQYMKKDTVYSVKLNAPVSFGIVTATELAPAGAAPLPGSIVSARLVTPVQSDTTPRATPIEAVVTEPVFSTEHQLILPQGSKLTGEVTFAKPAGRFHHNGQLRVLFEGVDVPERGPDQLRAALYSVEASRSDGITLDEEGGTTVANSNRRFVAPALASLALVSSIHHGGDGEDRDAGLDGGRDYGGGGGGLRPGGFFAMGLVGVGLAQISRPVSIGLAVVGFVRSTYRNVVGKGREVSFPMDTPIQVRLAPGPTPSASTAP
jgi:hypothetical protein